MLFTVLVCWTIWSSGTTHLLPSTLEGRGRPKKNDRVLCECCDICGASGELTPHLRPLYTREFWLPNQNNSLTTVGPVAVPRVPPHRPLPPKQINRHRQIYETPSSFCLLSHCAVISSFLYKYSLLYKITFENTKQKGKWVNYITVYFSLLEIKITNYSKFIQVTLKKSC